MACAPALDCGLVIGRRLAHSRGAMTARDAPADIVTAHLFGPPLLPLARPGPAVAERRIQLLAYLAVHAGQWLPRERLAALFWPERPPSEARRNLRKVLHEARSAVAGNPPQASEHAVRWSVETDLLALQRARQAARWADALALRRGPLLHGLDDAGLTPWAEWLAAERARADAHWRHAARQALGSEPEPARRAELARRLLEVDALDEDAVAALFEAEVAAGRDSLALRCYDDYAARLRQTLDIEPSRALRELRARLSARMTGGAASARPAAMPAAPAAPTTEGPFVGRRTEFVELRQLLAAGCRLVTVLGPGGVGKSRFTREALARLDADAAPPLWVDLVDLAELPALWARLAQTLGVEDASADDLERALTHALDAGSRLLVLDNAEHLPGLGTALDRLLDAAPALSLVVTSRARLHARHEVLLPLGGLAVPDDDSHDLQAAASFDAVRLFELRARAARRDFELARHLPGVIEIVAAVAGMPLAIELAANWVRLLPPQRIAEELRASIDVLERDPAGASPPQRPEHASMRAVLGQACARLAPAEREALAALSVFRGGFTLPAARVVAGTALPLLSSLVDKSLLAVGDDGRFTLHPLIAAYADEHLHEDAPARQRLRLRHAEHFGRELAALAPHAVGDVRLLTAALTPEFANACAAWNTALALRRSDLVAAMARTLWAFFELRSRQREGIDLLRPALALPDQGPEAALARARLAHGLSMLHHRLGEQADGLALARAGQAFAEHCGDTEAWVGCVLNAGSCLWKMGDVAAARAAFERGVAIAQQRGDLQCLAWARGNLAVALAEQGQLDAALALATDALAGSRAAGDRYNTAVHMVNIAHTLRTLGAPDRAARMLSDCLHHCDDHGLGIVALYASIHRGHVLLQGGDPAQAQAVFDDALQRAQRAGARTLVWTARTGLARIAISQRDAAAAREQLRAVLSEARRSPAGPELAVALVVHADLLELEGDAAGALRIRAAALVSGLLPAPARAQVQARLDRLPEAARAPTPIGLEAAIEAALR